MRFSNKFILILLFSATTVTQAQVFNFCEDPKNWEISSTAPQGAEINTPGNQSLLPGDEFFPKNGHISKNEILACHQLAQAHRPKSVGNSIQCFQSQEDQWACQCYTEIQVKTANYAVQTENYKIAYCWSN